MRKIRQEFKISKVENSSKLFLEINQNQYYIGEVVAFILELMSNNISKKEIVNKINASFCQDSNISDLDFDEIVEEYIVPLGVFDEEIVEAKVVFDEVKWRRTILKSDFICKLGRPFQFVYQPLFFSISFILILVANYYLVSDISSSIQHFDLGPYSVVSFGIVYALLFLIIVFHELGHSTATLNFGIKPKSIGVGIYFFFPVLYTDITEIWKLSKTKKVIISLAGVYNQLLANVILLVIANYITSSVFVTLISLLVLANLSIVMINLFPFLKYDAYWLYSDITGTRNLSEKSNEYITSFIKKSNNDYSLSLKLYSLSKLFIFGILYYYILNYAYYEIININEFFDIIMYFSFSLITILYISRTVMVFLFSGYVILSLVKIILNFVKSKNFFKRGLIRSRQQSIGL